jgi:hypothetical protein
MSEIETQAQAAMENLLKYDESQLYQQLGIRKKMLETNPTAAGTFNLEVTDDEASMMGLRDSLEELGQRLYQRWQIEAYNLICGGQAVDEADRKKLADAFGLNQMVLGAAIAGVLVSSVGLAPTIAAVIAAIAVKRFFRPGYEEFCKVWKKNLPELKD